MRWRPRAEDVLRARVWLAHRVMWLFYLPVLAALVAVVLPSAASIVSLVWIVFFGLSAFVAAHGSPVCMSCLRELLAYFPRQPQEVVRLPSVRVQLWAFHWLFASRRRMYGAVAVYVAMTFLAGWVTPMSARVGWWGVLYSALLFLPWALVISIYKRHALFDLFCPYCHGGGGGGSDETPEPTPEPVPTGEKVLQPA